MVKTAFLVKALFPVKVLFPVIALSPAAAGPDALPWHSRDHEPLILISLFCEFSAALQMSGYVSTDDGGNPFRAS